MVVLENVEKTYQTRGGIVKALRDINLHIEKGRFIAICGPSGSGKTTLLMAIAAMLRPTKGTVRIEQNDLYKMGIRDRARFRAENIGFIFQMFHLIPYLNVIENVILAGGVIGKSRNAANARDLLKQLGLESRVFHKPAQLSAGEKQRVAIARALFNRPKIMLADEPTGNLDDENAASVIGHLSEFHRSGGTVILATHQLQARKFASQVIYLRDGTIEKPKLC
jgi:ABC-type lipoprotein export system ATPase subunit